MERFDIDVDGVELHVAHGGAGARLLVLNGSGSSIERIEPLLEFFAASMEVACHDQRGLGRSAIPEPPWSMADYAHDALGVADHLGWDSFMVLGISFGGMVALEVAATAPERLERLVLLCTSPGGSASSFPLHELEGLEGDELLAASLRVTDVRFSPWWFLGHPADRAVVAAQRSAPALSPERQRGAALQLDARRHHDVEGRLGAVTCPTFVGAGRFDGIAPVENSRAIVREITGAELHVYDGGHVFVLQDRRALRDVVAFLEQRDPHG